MLNANLDCNDFQEWYDTGGMGETCILSLGHEGKHKSSRGGEWDQHIAARRLLPELHRLSRRDDAMKKYVDDLLSDRDITGTFIIAREIMKRLGAADLG